MNSLRAQSIATWLLVFAQTAFAAAQTPSAIAPAGAPAASPANGGPKIKFDSAVYDFNRVMAGDPVKHDFIFTNIGTETLEVTAVSPQCGCTTAGEWTHRVEPGATGVIPLEFNSGRFPGQTVLKTATVMCNDRTQPTVILELKGTVWVPIEVTPPNPVLSIIDGEPSNAPVVVRIVSHLDDPLTLSDPQVNNGSIAADLKTIQAGKEFQLVLRAVPPLPQSSGSALVSMKTSSTNVPVLNVSVMALVQPVVTVWPSQLMLPRNGTNAATPSVIYIRNNSASALTLSEPKFSNPGVGVQMKEVEAGRQFTLTMNFPPGFEIPQNTEADLTVKTSNPKLPIIKVPVRQQPPAPTVALPGRTLPPPPASGAPMPVAPH